jgi:hypothetical protein
VKEERSFPVKRLLIVLAGLGVGVGLTAGAAKPGEDYPGMAMKTIGEDNVLRLTVRVAG